MYDTVQTMAVAPTGLTPKSVSKRGGGGGSSLTPQIVSDLLLELSDRAFVLDDTRAGIALERASRAVMTWTPPEVDES